MIMKKAQLALLYFVTTGLAIGIFCTDVSRSQQSDAGHSIGELILTFTDSHGNVTTTNPSSMVVVLKNISTNEIRLAPPTLLPPVWFSITSPTGKNVSTSKPVEPSPDRPRSETIAVISPGQSNTFHYQVNAVRKMDEIGEYRFVANVSVVEFGRETEIASKPVRVIVLDTNAIEQTPRSQTGF